MMCQMALTPFQILVLLEYIGTPIINQPQVAIMAVGSITKKPVVIEVDGQDVIAITRYDVSFSHVRSSSSRWHAWWYVRKKGSRLFRKI